MFKYEVVVTTNPSELKTFLDQYDNIKEVNLQVTQDPLNAEITYHSILKIEKSTPLKQNPKKVFNKEMLTKEYNAGQDKEYIDTVGICPSCGSKVSVKYNRRHCGECNQRIYWSDEKNG